MREGSSMKTLGVWLPAELSVAEAGGRVWPLMDCSRRGRTVHLKPNTAIGTGAKLDEFLEWAELVKTRIERREGTARVGQAASTGLQRKIREGRAAVKELAQAFPRDYVDLTARRSGRNEQEEMEVWRKGESEDRDRTLASWEEGTARQVDRAMEEEEDPKLDLNHMHYCICGGCFPTSIARRCHIASAPGKAHAVPIVERDRGTSANIAIIDGEVVSWASNKTMHLDGESKMSSTTPETMAIVAALLDMEFRLKRREYIELRGDNMGSLSRWTNAKRIVAEGRKSIEIGDLGAIKILADSNSRLGCMQNGETPKSLHVPSAHNAGPCDDGAYGLAAFGNTIVDRLAMEEREDSNGLREAWAACLATDASESSDSGPEGRAYDLRQRKHW